ncbi:MAG: methyltransferase domain-containing protein [Gammaproteobacteria bacterium]|nr:methyltransferase domain-containing protein [Gammaproteobacteria bacterium]
MTELSYDEEATKRLLSVYVTPDVVAQRAQFLRALHPASGERVLDVGSGPGFLAMEIGALTGPSGAVSGVDISHPLLEVARTQCSELPWIEFHDADATSLPFTDASFDAVISTQVLEYVRDVDAALAEIHRVVRPSGRVIIVDTDWDSIVWHTSNRERMSRVLVAWKRHAADPYLPRSLSNKLTRAGFHLESQQVIPLFNPGFESNTYSNRVIDLIALFVTGCNEITRDEAEEWAQELRLAGSRGEYFFSLNRYMFVATPAS